VVEEPILAHHPREEAMNLRTDTYPATPPATVAAAPRRRWTTNFVALGMVALLAIGAGVGTAALLDDGSGSVARSSPATASVASTTDAETVWSYLDQLPAAERDQVLVALIDDPTAALGAIVTGMVNSVH
jgi:hypothetical protein